MCELVKESCSEEQARETIEKVLHTSNKTTNGYLDRNFEGQKAMYLDVKNEIQNQAFHIPTGGNSIDANFQQLAEIRQEYQEEKTNILDLHENRVEYIKLTSEKLIEGKYGKK